MGGADLHSAVVQEVCRQLAIMCEKALSAESHSGEQHQVCDLDGIEDIPIMPTLSGWLLQYPVIYLADAQTAPTLASLLSQASLQLHQMQAGGTVVEVSLRCLVLHCKGCLNVFPTV